MERKPTFMYSRPEAEPSADHPALLQTNHEFFDDFIETTYHEQRRAWVQNFYIEYCPEAELMADALITAAGNGADSRVYIDGWSYMVTQGRPDIMPIRDPELRAEIEDTRKKTQDLFYKMESNGVKMEITNRPAFWNRAIPEVGRNHDKTFISGDNVWKGGVNVNAYEFKKVDFMVKMQDPRIVTEYTHTLDNLDKNPEDREVVYFPDYTLLFDGGRVGSSIIYDRTQKLLNQPLERIQYISQVPPRAEMAKLLIDRAQEGTEIDVFLPYADSGFIKKKLHRPFYRMFVQQAEEYSNLHVLQLDSDVHAKGIQITLPDGKKVFEFGSHNFARIGVYAGTQESAIITTDPELNDQAAQYFESFQAA